MANSLPVPAAMPGLTAPAGCADDRQRIAQQQEALRASAHPVSAALLLGPLWVICSGRRREYVPAGLALASLPRTLPPQTTYKGLLPVGVRSYIQTPFTCGFNQEIAAEAAPASVASFGVIIRCVGAASAATSFIYSQQFITSSIKDSHWPLMRCSEKRSKTWGALPANCRRRSLSPIRACIASCSA